MAHLLFDGEIKPSHCTYHNRNVPLLKHVEERMRQVYDFEPKRYRDRTTGVARICYFNVALSAYMREKSRDLLQRILILPKDLKREFLRAFFNDEGCMDFRPLQNVRQIRGYQKNVQILKMVQKLLADLAIDSNIMLPNEVVIRGKENLQRFEKEIGFSAGVRVNGNRSNSIWKQHIEKKELLRRAIASFKPIGSSGVHRY